MSESLSPCIKQKHNTSPLFLGGGGFILFFALFLLFACDNYDSFTTNRSAVLTFSRDTVRFDTLIATVPSSTQTLIIFNKGDEGLRISQAALAGGASSPFRVNIDGLDLSQTTSNAASDFEVRRRDSLIVRIEVTVPPSGTDQPHKLTDALLLTLESGVQQRIPFEVVGRDAFFMKARTLTADTTMTARRPIVIYDSLVVASGTTLTLQAGTQLLFHEKAALIVHGNLKAQGTLEKPIIFRGDRTDHMFDYLPYDRLPSRWEGITIRPESFGNELTYIDLHSGLYGIQCDSTKDASTSKLKLLNSRIHNLGGKGLALQGCKAEVSNTEISNTLENCVSIIGGDISFLHCTLAQFYPFDAKRDVALSIANEHNGSTWPLYKADFINCIVTGYAEDELMGYWTDEEGIEANFNFINCSLRTESAEGTDVASQFINVVYEDTKEVNNDKLFKLFDVENFIYDFTPVAEAPFCGIAEPTYASQLPLDRLGRPRNKDGKPDAGCYESGE